MLDRKIDTDIEDIDRGTRITLGRKTVKVKPMSNFVAGKADRLILATEGSYDPEGKVLQLGMDGNRKLMPKYMAYVILRGWLKVKLFHWIYWRWLDRKYTAEELFRAMEEAMKLNDLAPFYHGLVSLQMSIRMKKTMAKAIITPTSPKQDSEAEPTE